MANELVQQVRDGLKTATTSEFLSYARDNESLPAVDGNFGIVLKARLRLFVLFTLQNKEDKGDRNARLLAPLFTRIFSEQRKPLILSWQFCVKNLKLSLSKINLLVLFFDNSVKINLLTELPFFAKIVRMRTKNQPIGRLLKTASNQMDRELTQFAAQLNLTGQQMLILDFLGQQLEEQVRVVNQNKLESNFNIRRSTTTEILQRMEKRQLIVRLSSPQDARQKMIQLTELGKNYLPKIKNYIKEHDKKVLTNLSKEEIAAVKKFLSNFSD